MNLSASDLILLLSVVLPILIPLGGALYKLLLDHLPSSTRQAVVDTVRIAAHAVASDPTIANSAEEADLAVLKELHLPDKPTFVKSLVTLFQQDVATPPAPQASTDGAQPATFPSVGFVPPVAQPTGPNLHR